jgi:hypothetical protein
MLQSLPSHVWVAHVFAYCTLAEVCRAGGCSTELHACAADPAVRSRATVVFRTTAAPVQTAGLGKRLRALASGWAPAIWGSDRADNGSGGSNLAGGGSEGRGSAESAASTTLTPAGFRALLRDGRTSLRTLELDGGIHTCWVSSPPPRPQYRDLKL